MKVVKKILEKNAVLRKIFRSQLKYIWSPSYYEIPSAMSEVLVSDEQFRQFVDNFDRNCN